MAFVRQKYIKGNLVYYSDALLIRYYDAVGPDVIKYVDDFVGGGGIDTAFDNYWTVTRVEAGAGESTMTRVDGVGGLARITTDANENDGINAQLIGSAFELTTDQHLYFGAFGCKISDATQSDFFLGLAATDTDILGGVTDRVGFESLDGSTDLKCMLEKDSTETLSASLATLADATGVDLEFYWNGDTGVIDFYVNGTLAATPATANLPNDLQLRLTWQFLAGSAGAKTMDIDRISLIQIGR